MSDAGVGYIEMGNPASVPPVEGNCYYSIWKWSGNTDTQTTDGAPCNWSFLGGPTDQTKLCSFRPAEANPCDAAVFSDTYLTEVSGMQSLWEALLTDFASEPWNPGESNRIASASGAYRSGLHAVSFSMSYEFDPVIAGPPDYPSIGTLWQCSLQVTATYGWGYFSNKSFTVTYGGTETEDFFQPDAPFGWNPNGSTFAAQCNRTLITTPTPSSPFIEANLVADNLFGVSGTNRISVGGTNLPALGDVWGGNAQWEGDYSSADWGGLLAQYAAA